MDEMLEQLFRDNFSEEETKGERKIKRLERLEIKDLEESEGEEENLDKELSEIIDGGSFGEYIPAGAKTESQKTASRREDVLRKYAGGSEKYEAEVENLLRVHLQFPSRDEIGLHRGRAWTNFKLLRVALEENRGSQRLYDGLKFHRTVILSKIGLREYVSKLPAIVSKIKNIVMKKVEDEIEYVILMDIFLSTFEKRILEFGDYLSCNYKDFEKQRLSFALELYSSAGRWEPFSHREFERRASPHELLFFPLSEVAGRLLVSDPKYPRYVRAGGPEWSYYYLESVSGGERYWKMDAWMDKLALSTEIIFNQCSSLYEKIYFDKYHDRAFRPHENKEGASEDLSVLFKNLKIMSNRKRCSAHLRKHLPKAAKYSPKKNDFFDKRNEDSSVFNIYQNITRDDMSRDWENTCKKLFYDYDPFHN